MNDTHGETGEGWYGFDLDGTLAMYGGWRGIDHIGPPVRPMVRLMRRMHDEGKVVKIVTARVAPHKLEDGTVGESYITVPDGEDGATRTYAHQFINDWCHLNLGFIPEIVYQKDHLMFEFYDDRAKQVIPNAGVLVEDQRDAAVRTAERRRAELCYALATAKELRKDLRYMKVLLGVSTASLVLVVLAVVLLAAPGLMRKPSDAELEGMARTYIELKGWPMPAEEAK